MKSLTKMKKIAITTVLLIFNITAFGQQSYAVIGGATSKVIPDGGGIVDFSETTTKGIVLPQLLNTGNVITPGTLFYDTVLKKVMYRDNTQIRDLSIKTGTYTPVANYNTLITASDKVSVIGTQTSNAVGVLILESNDKALILPKMASPHLKIVAPEAGTICYDTDKNLFCVFNGSEWTFWGE